MLEPTEAGLKKKSYLDEVMWRQWRGGDYLQIMANFISIIP